MGLGSKSLLSLGLIFGISWVYSRQNYLQSLIKPLSPSAAKETLAQLNFKTSDEQTEEAPAQDEPESRQNLGELEAESAQNSQPPPVEESNDAFSRNEHVQADEINPEAELGQDLSSLEESADLSRLDRLRAILSQDNRLDDLSPDRLLQAGEAVSMIEQEMAESPELFKQGMQFFDHCIQDPNLPETIRAICYFQLKEKNPDHPTLLQAQVPQNVLDEAESVR